MQPVATGGGGAFWNEKPIANGRSFLHEADDALVKMDCFLEKPKLSETLGGGLRERGWFSGGSTTNKPKGVRGVGVARTRLPPFRSLGWCRCAAPALLQTHSAFSASERCNFK